MVSINAVLFPRDVLDEILDEILDLIESVSEGFPTYSQLDLLVSSWLNYGVKLYSVLKNRMKTN